MKVLENCRRHDRRGVGGRNFPIGAYVSINLMSAIQRPKRFIKRPDGTEMKKEVDALREEIKQLDLANAEINAQIEKTVPPADVSEKRKTLQQQLKEIIAKQANFKQERNAIHEQIKNTDINLKRKVGEIQKVTAKNSFKNVREVDARIAHLDELVGSGTLKLAEERKTIKEMTSLRKLRKDYADVAKQQEAIDKDEQKIAELKKSLSSIGSKEVQQQFEQIQKELSVIDEANKSIYNKKSQLFDKRTKVKKSKDELYDKIKKLRADYDAEFAKFKLLLAEEQKKRDEEYKSHQAERKQSKLREIAEKRLAEALVPAFTHEISEIHSLLSYFDPNYVKTQKNTIAEATKSQFESNRPAIQVDMPEDVVILKKEQQSFFEGSKLKKNKKKAPKKKAFTVDPEVIISLADLSIPLPTSNEDVPETIQVLKETLDALESKQADQTNTNIEKAKAEIAKLDADSIEDSSDEED